MFFFSYVCLQNPIGMATDASTNLTPTAGSTAPSEIITRGRGRKRKKTAPESSSLVPSTKYETARNAMLAKSPRFDLIRCVQSAFIESERYQLPKELSELIASFLFFPARVTAAQVFNYVKQTNILCCHSENRLSDDYHRFYGELEKNYATFRDACLARAQEPRLISECDRNLTHCCDNVGYMLRLSTYLGLSDEQFQLFVYMFCIPERICCIRSFRQIDDSSERLRLDMEVVVGDVRFATAGFNLDCVIDDDDSKRFECWIFGSDQLRLLHSYLQPDKRRGADFRSCIWYGLTSYFHHCPSAAEHGISSNNGAFMWAITTHHRIEEALVLTCLEKISCNVHIGPLLRPGISLVGSDISDLSDLTEDLTEPSWEAVVEDYISRLAKV